MAKKVVKKKQTEKQEKADVKKEATKLTADQEKRAAEKSKPKENGQLNEAYIEGIIEQMNDMFSDLRKSPEKKSAAARARKKSTELAKVFKEFRANSIAHHK